MSAWWVRLPNFQFVQPSPSGPGETLASINHNRLAIHLVQMCCQHFCDYQNEV